MKYTTKSALGATLALALTAPAVHALNIDFTGTSNIGSSVYFQNIGWAPGGSAILGSAEDATQGVPTATGYSINGTFYTQNSFDFGGTGTDVITYQLIMPVTYTVQDFGGVIGKISVSASAAQLASSVFAMYLDTTPIVNDSTGVGYGDLGTVADQGSSNQVMIAKGVIASIGASGFGFTIDDLTATQALDTLNYTNIQTRAITGSTNLNVNIGSQNNDYVVSDLVNAGLTIDMTLQDLSFTAPFQPPNIGSQKVVSVTPFFGVDNLQDNTCTVGQSSDRTTCDLLVQQSGNSRFFDKRVPEPTTLALAGLGLTVLGFRTRRRRT